MNYYFAYGSNMDLKQMEKRCPESKLLGKGVLADYKLGFTIYSHSRNCGCADIISSQNSEVWGLIYSVTDSDLNSLDKYEGVHTNNYKRIQVEIVNESDNKINVETYEVVNKSREYIKTSKSYLLMLINAAEGFGFPEKYVAFLKSFETLD